jgi:hypothetical protein
MARVFVSHSNLDHQAASRIKNWLQDQGFEAPFLDFDKHTGIAPGAEWEQVLYREIQRTQALLILRTKHWDDSKWCFVEFTQARALGKPVFEIVEEEAIANKGKIVPSLQRLDLSRSRDDGLASLKKELIQIAEKGQAGFTWPPPGDTDRPPFPGLAVFEKEDAAIFFGRDNDWRMVIEKLRSFRLRDQEKILVIHGSSGSGKSSLLRAGVLPRLKRAGREWIVLEPFNPRKRPLYEFAMTWSLALKCNQDYSLLYSNLRSAIASQQVHQLLSSWSDRLRMQEQTPEAQIILAVDQAEELFTISEPEETDLFIQSLDAILMHSLPLQIVLTIRADAIGELQNRSVLLNRIETYPLQLLPKERYRDIIQGPFKVANRGVEDSLIETIIRDTKTENALPLLAYALRVLWTQKNSQDFLLSDYINLGNEMNGLNHLENIIQKQADDALKLKDLPVESLKELEKTFIGGLVRINAEGTFSRQPLAWSRLSPVVIPLIQSLVKQRLLIIHPASGANRCLQVEIAHESLMQVWPQLSEWLSSWREILSLLHHLETDYKVFLD